jgi:hypothetical protein
MLREVKFWTRDILRGPRAMTPIGYYVSAGLTALVVGIAFYLLLFA